jgi:septum formation protein
MYSTGMTTSPPVLLASGSAYRKSLLERIIRHFDCVVPDIDETRLTGETAQASALRLSGLKASKCADIRPEAITIGSDQVPALGEETLGKPGTHERAIEQLQKCAGRSVIFHTAVSVIGPDRETLESHIDRTTVKFRSLGEEEIKAYLNREKPYDCAGSFKAEALGIVLFEHIETKDPTAILGLPLIWLSGCLRRRGVTFF